MNKRGQCPPCVAAWIGGSFAFALILVLILWAENKWAHPQHVQIVKVECGWDKMPKVHVRLRNMENIYKVMSIYVQAKFTPPKGQTWPSQSLQEMFEQITIPWTIVLEPRSDGEEDVPFPVPDAEDYSCSAKVSFGREEQFKERPSEELMKALRESAS